MLIHGRLLVTEHGFMLDEVKSLLQKALRRNEIDLVTKATKELTCGKRDQLQWKGCVTFLFEDHCLTHESVMRGLYRRFLEHDKRGFIEILTRCYTCRFSACLQVVAIGDEYRKYEDFWDINEPVNSNVQGIVWKSNGTIDCERLLTLIVQSWKVDDFEKLKSLFGLVNMVAKVENRQLTNAGVLKLLDRSTKKPTLYHLVLSLIRSLAEDDTYMKDLIAVCYKFLCIPDVPQGLIMFSVLTQKIYKATVVKTPPSDMSIGHIKWSTVGQLTAMPDWATDKHTYRGKFGKSSAELFKRKYGKQFSFSEEQLDEFHGERTKVGIPHFFDVGCICQKDILPENPIWEKTKQMYFDQKPKQRKTAKMIQIFYADMRKKKSVIFDFKDNETHDTSVENESLLTPKTKRQNQKRKAETKADVKPPETKQRKLTDSGFSKLGQGPSTSEQKAASVSVGQERSKKVSKRPNGPLLQLPTGSGKVYTFLDSGSNKVWKGPYHSRERLDLCKFLHLAMREIFGDRHTLSFEEEGAYIIFPLIKSQSATVAITKRAFYDCIAKQAVSEDDGQFVERESLGIVQLHKLSKEKIARLPVSIWGHFVFRYALNIGDTGLYNAIGTEDLGDIFGIDMEEHRKQVKGNDVINMMFGKLPRKEIVPEIKKVLCERVEDLYKVIDKKFDFEGLKRLYMKYGVADETERCRERLSLFKKAVDRLCQESVGI